MRDVEVILMNLTGSYWHSFADPRSAPQKFSFSFTLKFTSFVLGSFTLNFAVWHAASFHLTELAPAIKQVYRL